VQPFLNVTTNPSYEVTQLLSTMPSRLPTRPSSAYEVIVHPLPLKASYRSLLSITPSLLQEHDYPDVILHMGLAADRDYFTIEKGAFRDGYHQIPDVDGQVLGKDERKGIWGRASAERLESQLYRDSTLGLWKEFLAGIGKGKGKAVVKGAGPKMKKNTDITTGSRKKGALAAPAKKKRSPDGKLLPPDIRLSDDVGSYVCGLLFYASMAAVQDELKKVVPHRHDMPGTKHVVFLHVPPMEGEEELRQGAEVITALVQALVADIRGGILRDGEPYCAGG